MAMTDIRMRTGMAALLAGAALAAAAPPSLAFAAKGSGAGSLISAVRDDMAADVAARLRDRDDVNARDDVGTTALAWAAIRNNPVVVRQLLSAGADPNLVDVTGVGPLAIAVSNDARDIVAMLLEKGADPNAVGDSGETPLMTSVRMGSPEVVKMLLAHGAKVNVSERRFGQTALMWATGKPEIVRLLLDKGADATAVTKAWEITATNYTPITFTLGVTGIPWNNDGEYKVRSGGQNALMFAVLKNDLESVRMLLDAGLDVNQRSADGTTPLIAALYHWKADKPHGLKYAADLKIANLLLDRGAKVNVADQTGYTPLHGALLSVVLEDTEGALRLAFNPGLKCEPNRPRPTPAKDDEVAALVKRLLDQGADPNAPVKLATPGPVNVVRINPAPPGSTPFHVAAATRSARLVRLLAENGADPNRVRNDGHTPFSIAVINNDLPVVQEMVAHGADVKMRFNPLDEISDKEEPKTQKRRNQTILHIAAVSGSEWVVDYLAKQGAPLDARNDLGETPLDLADAQELYRFRKDSEGPVGGVEVKPTKRETQTTDALKALMQGKLASAKTTPRARPAS
jgi:ankyrin repeat protein